MKTFKKTITVEEPRLKIYPCEITSNPRNLEDNLGYFLTKDRNLISPDEEKAPTLQEIMEDTGDEADNQADHIKRMKKRINKETEEEVVVIYPMTKYEHSGVKYMAGNYFGFDHSNNGFYIITDKTQKEAGIEKDFFKKAIEQEIEIYNYWVNGDVWGFELYDEKGNLVEEEKGGIYGLESVKEFLPEEWQGDLNEYIVYQEEEELKHLKNKL